MYNGEKELSAGLDAHVLTIENKELLLRIIDTAGIGDTRGNLFIFKKYNYPYIKFK